MNQENNYLYFTMCIGLLVPVAILSFPSNPVLAAENRVMSVRILPEKSNFICYSAEEPKITLGVNNPSDNPQSAALSYDVLSFLGQVIDSKQHAIHLQPHAAKEMSVSPKISEAGYYDIKVQLKREDNSSQVTYWSLVILSEEKELSKNSPFGVYTISSEQIIQDIIPKGYLQLLKRSGAQWGTFTFYWFLVQPTSSTWDWTIYDRRFANLKEAGLQPLPHLFGTPPWASRYEEGMPAGGDGATHYVYPPKDLSAWGEFVYRVVDRYRDDLTCLRIWNEFDTQYWMGSIKDFAELLKVAYREAHRAKADIKIVIDTSFAKMCLYEMLHKYGAGDCFDVISIHNYQFDKCLAPEQTMFEQDYAAVLAWRDKRRPDCPVWDTEFGWYSEKSWSDPNWLGHGELAQAQYLVRAYVLGLSVGVERMIWFPAYSYGIDVNGEHYVENAGLLRENMSPKPAYAAYHTISTLLHDAKFSRKLDVPSPAEYAYEFQAGSEYTTVLWSINENPEWITLRAADDKLQRITMLGSRSTIDADKGLISLELTPSPSYLISSNKLEVETRVLALPDLQIDLTREDETPAGPNAPITLGVSNKSAKSRYLCVNAANTSPHLDPRIELEIPPGQSVPSKETLIVPSANSTGKYQTRIVVGDKGGPKYRFPVSIKCKKAKKSLWRAKTGDTPARYHRVLSEPRYVESVLITFPAKTAYQFKVEVCGGEDRQPEWFTVSPEDIGQDTQYIPVNSVIRGLRVTFNQMLKFAGAEDQNALVTRKYLSKMGISGLSGKWETFRDYVNVKAGPAHTGNSCFEIPGIGRSKTDPHSTIEQFVPVEGNSYYTFTAYARMPVDVAVEGWAGLYVIGVPTPVPHCFVVLPFMDGEWHKLSMTIKTQPRQDKLRVVCLMSHNGLVYFDDIMGIPGKIPTDIPEIVSLDFLGRDKDNKLCLVK